MPTSIPTKMSQFESVNSLSTASYIIGLDMYGGYLANIKISGSAAGYELSRKRWILNPPVSSPSDPRGHDGAESYDSSGAYWVKSGSVWIEIANLVNSASYALQAESLLTGINVDVNAITASSITVSNLHVQIITSSVSLVTGSLMVDGELYCQNVTASNIQVGNVNISNNVVVSGSLDVLGASRLLGANTLINFETFGDGIWFVSGSSTPIGFITNASSRMNFSAGSKLTNGFVFNTNSTSGAVYITNDGSIRVYGSGSFGKTSAPNAVLDVNGDAIISGSLISTGGITGSLLGTASYALNAKRNYNVKNYGAIGDGMANDTTAIISAINAVQAAGYGTVYFPDGTYLITGSLTIPSNPQCDIVLEGDGSSISTIKQTSNTHAIYFDMTGSLGFAEYQVAIKNLGFRTSGQADTAIYITYGPNPCPQHQYTSVDINDVNVYSDGSNYWGNGIVLESAWNFRITNTVVVGRLGSYSYNGVGLEIKRMCVNGSIEQSQFNFWNKGIFVNTVDYTSSGQNTEGLLLNQIYMVPVNYGLYAKGNKSFTGIMGYDWANRPNAGRVALLTMNNSHIDSRYSGSAPPTGSAVYLENVQGHYISNNLFIGENTQPLVYGKNAHEGTFIGNTLFNSGSSPSIYIGGYSGSANIITGNIFRGGSTHVLLESSSLYNKVYGNVSYDYLNILITDAGTNNLTGSVGN